MVASDGGLPDENEAAGYQPARRLTWNPDVSRNSSQALDNDHRQLVGRRLHRVAVFIHLHERIPSVRRASRRREQWRVERIAEMEQDLPNPPWVCDEYNESDVATAAGAHERKVFGDLRHGRGPGESRRVVGTDALLAAADPLTGLVSGEGVTDAVSVAMVGGTQGEPLGR